MQLRRRAVASTEWSPAVITAATLNGTTHSYLYDGSFAHAQVLEERDAAGALAARYTLGHRRIAQERSGVRSELIHDALGSTKALASPDGEVTDTWTYEAFGAITDHAGSTEADFLYAGEQWDPELGMQYLRARWMDPASGRFASRDPFEGMRTRPLTLNAMAYADLSPLGRVDPSGRSSAAELGVGAAILGIITAIDIASSLHGAITEPSVGNAIWLGVSILDGPIPTVLVRRGAKIAARGIAMARAARIVGKTGRKLLGETVIRGLVAGRRIADLTNAEIIQALHGAGWDVTHHFLQRLREARTSVRGIETLEDVARLLNNGVVDDAGEGLLAVARGGIAVLVDPITKRIVNIRPW